MKMNLLVKLPLYINCLLAALVTLLEFFDTSA